MPLTLRLPFVSTCWKICLKELSVPQSMWILKLSKRYGNLRFKGIVSDYGSTALALTYIGFGIKIPTNLGFWNVTKWGTLNHDLTMTRRTFFYSRPPWGVLGDVLHSPFSSQILGNLVTLLYQNYMYILPETLGQIYRIRWTFASKCWPVP